MIPNRITGATRALGAPKDWDAERDGSCCVLPILDVLPLGGEPHRMVSSWQPTPAEAAAIAAGAPVLLHVVGTAHPPVWLAVGEVPE